MGDLITHYLSLITFSVNTPAVPRRVSSVVRDQQSVVSSVVSRGCVAVFFHDSRISNVDLHT